MHSKLDNGGVCECEYFNFSLILWCLLHWQKSCMSHNLYRNKRLVPILTMATHPHLAVTLCTCMGSISEGSAEYNWSNCWHRWQHRSLAWSRPSTQLSSCTLAHNNNPSQHFTPTRASWRKQTKNKPYDAWLKSTTRSGCHFIKVLGALFPVQLIPV